MKKILNHNTIGIDIDGTIIDHKNSEYLQDMVREFHKTKSFYLVTFRTHGWETQVFREMRQKYGFRSPSSRCFIGILNIPVEIYNNAMTFRSRGLEEYAVYDQLYKNWKGYICKKHDITILIDDRPEDVLPGCLKYGVEFMHPDQVIDDGSVRRRPLAPHHDLGQM